MLQDAKDKRGHVICPFLITLTILSIPLFAQDYSGTYFCDISGSGESIYIQIVQNGSQARIQFHITCPYYYGTVDSDTLTAALWESGVLTITFSINGDSFSGIYWFPDESGTITGIKVPDEQWPGIECWDFENLGIPRFVNKDYTELEKISEISRFRSGEGHDYSDDFESCRSMKHYYAPFSEFKDNNLIEIYSPVNGTIIGIRDEQHGSSEGLTNKQVHIKSNEYPAFIFVIFHTDLISADIAEDYPVAEGQLLGHARMFYPTLNEYAHSFDIAVQVNSYQGQRYISFFETMTPDLFDDYIKRGAISRFDFIITQQERDDDPLGCDGETFLSSGSLENWVSLTFNNGFDFCGPDFGPEDFHVDRWDLSFLLNHWLRSDCTQPDYCQRCDTNHDGRVDLVDLSSFCRHWLWE